MLKVRRIIKNFKPSAVVGVGGFASGPALRAATSMNIPTLIQEQNSFPGVTNRILSQKVNKICVAYNDMEKYFPSDKIVLTGNPVRQNLYSIETKSQEAYSYFGLSPEKKTVLIVGGSLGARTINLAIFNDLDKLVRAKIQIIWQTGKGFFAEANAEAYKYNTDTIKVHDFISRMDYAYSVADLVVSRAGASTISELCVVGKPTIFVPSPNVAEDHQTKNAMAIIKNNAAAMVTDAEAKDKLIDDLIALIKNEVKLKEFSNNISKMAIKQSDEMIVDELLKIIKD